MHPLDPLSPAEIDAAVAAARADGRLSARTRFWGAYLDEEHARAIVAGNGTAGERRIELIIIDNDARAGWEAHVLVPVGGGEGRVESWNQVDHRGPGMTSEEARAAAMACREDEGFRAAMAKRGITDMSMVMIDAESIGGFVPEAYAERRLTWGSVWLKTEQDHNAYCRPIQGVVPIIDMDRMEVLEVEDHGMWPLSDEAGPMEEGSWSADRPQDPYDGDGSTDPTRTERTPALRPLEVVQPDGPSFDVDGWKVSWQGWEFRVGFTHREGLVLYDLGFMGRSVLARAAANEMYVPYLDPTSTQYRKNFFDWGEYGAGPLTNSLELGCDCLGVIHYFDGSVLSGDGDARQIKQAVCMHEEDFSLLWKHTDSRRDAAETRRSRRLVISSFHTVANYDYGFYWNLYQDGVIELEIKLTGILSVSGVEDEDPCLHGRRVARNVSAATHQHYFAMRLDPAIDGENCRFVEVHAEPEPDPEKDPYGNAVRTVRTPLLREGEAAQRNDPATARHWRIESADKKNRYGEPTAYRLQIPDTTRSFCRPDSVMAARAPFINNHVWATPFHPAEQYIGGRYPNQAEPGADGVHVWQQQDRSIDGERLVVWPVLGSHHMTRPEEWPVMPVDRIHMTLRPDGFFDRNPTLDVARPKKADKGGCCAADGDGTESCH